MNKLDEWQREAIEHKGNILLCTGRRVGKTWIMSYKAVKRMLEKKTRIVVVSLTEEQAMLIIAMVKNILYEIDPKAMKSKKEDTNKKTVTIKNGSKLICRPVGEDGDSLRGYEADIVIIDEASRMGKLFWIAITPIILTTRGEMWLCSTPHGKQGYFWDRFNEAYNLKEDNSFKVIYTSTEQVINNRPISITWTEEQKKAALKQLEFEKRTMSAIEYGQEYMGLFLEELRQFFPDEVIAKACTQEKGDFVQTGSIFLGVDIARMGGDKIAYEFVEKIDDTKYIHRQNITKAKQDTYITEQEILQLNEIWKPEQIGIDAGSGSLGVGIYDRLLHNPKTRSKVKAMTNQKISLNRDGTDKQRIFKEDMYENLKYLMETGKIVLLNDPEVKASLKSVQIEVEAGKVRIFAHPSADIVEGLVRAAYLAEKAKINKLYITYF